MRGKKRESNYANKYYNFQIILPVMMIICFIVMISFLGQKKTVVPSVKTVSLTVNVR